MRRDTTVRDRSEKPVQKILELRAVDLVAAGPAGLYVRCRLPAKSLPPQKPRLAV